MKPTLIGKALALTVVGVTAVSLAHAAYASATVSVKNCYSQKRWVGAYNETDGVQWIPATSACISPGQTVTLSCSGKACGLAVAFKCPDTTQINDFTRRTGKVFLDNTHFYAPGKGHDC